MCMRVSSPLAWAGCFLCCPEYYAQQWWDNHDGDVPLYDELSKRERAEIVDMYKDAVSSDLMALENKDREGRL